MLLIRCTACGSPYLGYLAKAECEHCGAGVASASQPLPLRELLRELPERAEPEEWASASAYEVAMAE